MPLRLRSSIVAAVALAGVSLVGEARAFCRVTTAGAFPNVGGCARSGQPLFWRNACVGISYQKSEGRKLRTDDLAVQFNKAFATWTGVTCPGGGHPSIAVKQLASTATTEVAFHQKAPNVNLVIMRDDDWPHTSSGGPDITMPTVSFKPETGEIVDADIELNTKDNDFALSDPVPPDAYDLQTVLLRTAGRILGLAESDDTGSVMYGYTSGYAAAVQRSLSPDDIAGICEIYPPDGTRKVLDGKSVVAGPCDPIPRNGLDEGPSTNPADNGCAVASETPAGGGVVVVALAALTLVGVRRRRAAVGD